MVMAISYIARISDFWGVIPAITGKVEMVYEGEQEGPQAVATHLISEGIKRLFVLYFPNPVKQKRGQERDPYGVVKAWFAGGNIADVMANMTEAEYMAALNKVAGLKKLAETSNTTEADLNVFMELVLHGLAAFDVLSRERVQTGLFFKDYLAGEMDDDDDDDMRDLLN